MSHYECSECGVFMGFCGCASKRVIERPPQSEPALVGSEENVMTLSVIGLNAFAREISHEGKVCKVKSVGIGDEFVRADRFRSLLRQLVFNDCIDVKTLNEIGFSRADASDLGMSIEGLENINPPPRSQWDE
jgi:hypothetical protein